MKAPLSPAAPQRYIVRESTASWLALEIEKNVIETNIQLDPSEDTDSYTVTGKITAAVTGCPGGKAVRLPSIIRKWADINALPNRPVALLYLILCPQASRSSMTKTSVTKRTLLRQGLSSSWCISKFTYLHHTWRNTISSESGLIILLPPHLRRLQLQFQFAKCTKTSGGNVSRCRSHTVLARNDSESNLRLLN